MGLDARVRYTKMVIKESFMGLLAQMPVGKVTVKAICDGASINRATFYRYYPDVFSLLECLEEELLDGLRAVMKESIEQGSEGTLERILCAMKEKAGIYQVLCAHGNPDLPLKVFRECYGATAEFIAQRYPTMPEEQRAWLYSYVAQGVSGILNCWIAEGLTASPSDVAAFAEKLIEGSLGIEDASAPA